MSYEAPMLTGTLIEDFSNVLMVGLALVALVALIQKLPWPSSWLQRKPLGCAVCLTCWGAIGGWTATGELSWPSVLFWAAGAGAGLMFGALEAYLRPMPPPM